MLGLRAGPGAALGGLILLGQLEQGRWVDGLAFGGVVVLLFLGWGMAHFIQAKDHRRHYATTWIGIPLGERCRRGSKWLAAAIVLGGFFTWALFETKGLDERWGFALLCFLAFAAPGVFFLCQRRRRELTKEALKAKSYYETLEKRAGPLAASAGAVDSFVGQVYRATFIRAFGRRGTRYLFAVVAFALAWYLAFEAMPSKNTTSGAWLAVLAGLGLAWDALLWLIGAAIVIGLFVLLFQGIAALPVSVAVIIGALIIASSVSGGK